MDTLHFIYAMSTLHCSVFHWIEVLLSIGSPLLASWYLAALLLASLLVAQLRASGGLPPLGAPCGVDNDPSCQGCRVVVSVDRGTPSWLLLCSRSPGRLRRSGPWWLSSWPFASSCACTVCTARTWPPRLPRWSRSPSTWWLGGTGPCTACPSELGGLGHSCHQSCSRM